MPVYSMTGYASVTHERGLSVECRSVNGRFLDLSLKLPEELRACEPALREAVATRVKRGKLELRLHLATAESASQQPPTPEGLRRLAQWQSQVHAVMPQAAALSVAEMLAWGRSLAPATPSMEAAEVLAATQACLDALADARAREGQRLVQILLDRIGLLESLAARAEPLVPAVVQRQQSRFLERWSEALQAADAATSVGPQALQERAMGEAAAFALRIDVAEELSRLKAHLQEIRHLLDQGGELGKRLDFLIQELHREANTLGSKSAALELTALSVDMKVAIEQMREQVQNIE
jgi:uncharacterized protein (TIGR00255 family)